MIRRRMRALLWGLIVLGLAAVLPPWSAPDHSTEIEVRPSAASAEAGIHAARRPAATEQAMADRAVHGSGHAVTISGSAPAASGNPAPSLKYGATTSVTAIEKRSQRAAPIGEARPFAGAKTHSQAIASFIESDRFTDMVGPLARLYFAYFERYPDQEGLDYYVGQRERGRPLDSIAEEFAGSREFDMRYGSIDNAAFIDRVYRNVFGASPDAAQRAYWAGLLDSGMSRGQVMLAFSEGADFRMLTSNEVFVATAYTETLQRTPDHEGFVRWVRFLDDGNPRDAVIDGLLRSRGP